MALSKIGPTLNDIVLPLFAIENKVASKLDTIGKFLPPETLKLKPEEKSALIEKALKAEILAGDFPAIPTEAAWFALQSDGLIGNSSWDEFCAFVEREAGLANLLLEEQVEASGKIESAKNIEAVKRKWWKHGSVQVRHAAAEKVLAAGDPDGLKMYADLLSFMNSLPNEKPLYHYGPHTGLTKIELEWRRKAIAAYPALFDTFVSKFKTHFKNVDIPPDRDSFLDWVKNANKLKFENSVWVNSK